MLLIDDVEYKLDFNFLNYINDTNCDEFIYEDGKCKIIRRVGVDADGNLYATGREVVETKKVFAIIVPACLFALIFSVISIFVNSEILKKILDFSAARVVDSRRIFYYTTARHFCQEFLRKNFYFYFS